MPHLSVFPPVRLTETCTVWAVDAVTTGINGDGLTEEKTGRGG